MKRYVSRVLKLAGMLVLLAVVLLALLQTTKGKEMLASALSHAMSRPGSMEVHIGRISGWIPVDVRIESVEIGDAQGTWLTVRNLQGRWILRDLFHGRIRLKGLGADEVDWLRFPKSAKVEPVDRQGGGLANMDIVLQGWSVKRFNVGPGVAGIPLEYTVQSGGIVLTEGQLSGDLDIGGDAVGRVNFNAVLASAATSRLTIQAELDAVRKPTFGLDRFSSACKATINAKGLDATLTGELMKGDMAGHVSTRVTYASHQLRLEQFQFNGAGCEADGDLDLDFSKGLIDMHGAASIKDAKSRNYALQGSARVSTSNGTWLVDVPSLTLKAWNTVSLAFSGRFNPDQMDVHAHLSEFDIASLPFAVVSNFEGKMSGDVSINGTTASPLVNAQLDVNRFTTSSAALDKLPELDFRISGGVSNGMVFAATSLTNCISGYFAADAAMPCVLSVYPFRFKLDPGKTHGSVDAILDLGVFNGLAILQNQHVDGYLTTELTIENGVPAGFILLEKGAYDHYEWGVHFQDFNARIEVAPDGFVVSEAKARDGASGRLKLAGGMSDGKLNLLLDLSKAKIIRRPDVQAMISGALKLTGPINRPNVAGKLVVDRADLLPDNIISAFPPLLENYDANVQQDTADARPHTRKPFPLGVDVKVEMPDQLYVNASLIDSVWGGALRLRDSAYGLNVKGSIEPRRGFVAFIGKKFRFLDGSVDLDGSMHSVPVLNNLTAEYSRSDITARLVLNGSIDHPQCILTSTPELPEDEILSQVLFKRDTSAISPYQAIQIASAAQQLSGGLSGPGFLYQFRQAVRVDTLEWREPETADGSSSVAAGKYITPELYIEVNSTIGSDAETDMSVEYEINRHFSVETSAGPKLRPGIGLNWKTDY